MVGARPTESSMRDPSKASIICGKQTRMSGPLAAVIVRYEGELNGIPNAAVILSYPKDGFGNPKALRVFLSTNAELSTGDPDTYTKRWPIELFFRRAKVNLRWIVIKSDPVMDHVVGPLFVLYAFWKLLHIRRGIRILEAAAKAGTVCKPVPPHKKQRLIRRSF